MSLDIRSRPVGESSESESTRRGPLRPERLVSVRRRQDRRLAGHRFRAVDTVMLIVATFIFLRNVLDQSILETPIAEVVPIAVGVWLTWLMIRALGLYRFGRAERLLSHLGRVVIATGAAAGVAAAAHLVMPAEQTEVADAVLLVALCGAGLMVLHAAWWLLVSRWRSRGLLKSNVVVVGATSHAEDLISTAIARRNMNILGVFDDRADRSPRAVLGVPVLGSTGSMLRHRIMPYVDLVVVTIDPSASARVRLIMDRLAVLPNDVTLLFDDSGAMRRVAVIDQIADAPLAPLHPATNTARKAHAKRVQDLVIGGLAFIIFAPLMAALALVIKLDSRGPVFFRQRREGFNNEEISVWKFRTMRHESADPHAVRQVTADDDRVTRVGGILRKSSLDELPQLFNVILGEMSLVGPCPHAIGMQTGDVDSAGLVAEYAHRHRIKPGMTGWAAINGSRGPLHNPEDVSRRVALDIDYIERQSVWFDLEIMVKTIPSLLGDRAAIR